MKILLIHSYYNYKGGEDAVFEQETELLATQHEVRKLVFKNNESIYGLFRFALSLWNFPVAKTLRNSILRFKPDIIHIHNWHFATGPIIIRTAKKLDIPVILTLHNYRLLCPSATLLYNGAIYKSSINSKFPWDAIRKKVYKKSIILTFWIAFVVWYHKIIGTWRLVDSYITLTPSQQNIYRNSNLGVSNDRIVVKPNFTTQQTNTYTSKENYFVFVGRLSVEKGIQTLIEAIMMSGYSLKIIGEGPLGDYVTKCCNENEHIEWLGHLPYNDVIKQIEGSTCLVLPSLCLETFGLVLIESFSRNTSVICANHGSGIDIVQHKWNGLHFEAGNVKSLKEQLMYWEGLPDAEKEVYRQNARETYLTHYTPEENLRQLNEIYKSVMKP